MTVAEASEWSIATKMLRKARAGANDGSYCLPQIQSDCSRAEALPALYLLPALYMLPALYLLQGLVRCVVELVEAEILTLLRLEQSLVLVVSAYSS